MGRYGRARRRRARDLGLILLVVGALGFVIALGLEISARSRGPVREERVEYRE